MPILELTISVVANGQELLNRWNYVVTGGSVPVIPSFSNALITALGYRSWIQGDGEYTLNEGLNFANAYRQFLCSPYRIVGVVVSNLYDTFDFDTYVPDPQVEGVGARGTSDVASLTNNPTPTWLTVGYTSNRTRQDIRAGQKRISGLTEFDVQSWGRINAEALNGFVRALGVEMSRILDLGGGWLALPAVLSREKYAILNDVGEPSGRYAYRPYPSEESQLANSMYPVTWTAKPFARSQVSRQVGRGR